jgi:hypothetical protein
VEPVEQNRVGIEYYPLRKYTPGRAFVKPDPGFI